MSPCLNCGSPVRGEQDAFCGDCQEAVAGGLCNKDALDVMRPVMNAIDSGESVEYCTACGEPVKQCVTANITQPVSAADIRMFQDTRTFFPHFDVDVACPSCGAVAHRTYPVVSDDWTSKAEALFRKMADVREP